MTKSANIPKDAVESTEALMKRENVTDKIDQMDGDSGGESGGDSIGVEVIRELPQDAESVPMI